MASTNKSLCLQALEPAVGKAALAAKGNSLYRTQEGTTLYLRYSRRHVSGNRVVGFYGLRTSDLRFLQQQPKAAVVFHTDDADDLFFIPLPRLLEFLEPARSAQDGMYKLQITFSQAPEMILAGAGRVGLGGFQGVPLTAYQSSDLQGQAPERQHTLLQMQIKEIGLRQGFNVWVPRNDRGAMIEGKRLGEECADKLEIVFPQATRSVVENIDVLWLNRKQHKLEAMFEVEHSTTIYSGLLRLNDVFIDCPTPSVNIVTDARRLDVFIRHVSRRTFEVSGLSKACSHYTYEDIAEWHSKLT